MNPILEGWSPPARPTHPRPAGAAVTRLSVVGEITVEGAIPLFRAIEAARGDSIAITIGSEGGNALCSLALFELLITHPWHVTADIERASSGAALVALGADIRRIAPGGRILLHETRADLRDVSAETLRSTLADLELVDAMCAGILAEATGQPPAQVAAWRRSTTTFNARQAIGAGIAHEIA